MIYFKTMAFCLLFFGLAWETIMDLFTEPTQVYSNVQNGMGVVCSQSQPVIILYHL